MGFNTWNAYGPDMDEQLVLQTAGFLNNLTLSKLGYNLIVLDGATPTPRANSALARVTGLWRLLVDLNVIFLVLRLLECNCSSQNGKEGRPT